ncbi:hypothetical protein CEP48_02580 [Mergibacter septicus]|uniref:Glycosyltransferase 2-like domain-containing protein n=1 Tax=Mergibacter septicus TaxID=221402 RepID=A0A8E3MFS0_9PAST|nr:glycosyltransferase family 2 protein [Mergibacter septicus]AWX15115.1 hypothetical protein CEP47_02580 [Mergibacter septicus]QDJ14368.1 hypothetical protein CEP48_02580 [Mergibacter septicus]UTU48192.1 glycosyltransferase family 2 protein [Mergibacter septicus]WMR96189.1 glycosyltransferase family 2 protein [Mergibacter septicus]
MRKISIVIPVYQAEKFIIEAIESCINQTYQNIEVVIVDDGCTDNSINLILPYLSDTRLKLIQHPCNLGTFAARKTGVLNCSGDNVLFLDPDDKLELHACEELAKYSDKDLVIFQIFWQKDNTCIPKKLSNRNVSNIANFIIDNKYYINYSSAGKLYNIDVLKQALNSLDFVQEKFILAEDAVLFLATLPYIKQVYFLKEVLYFYRYNVNSITAIGATNHILNQYDFALIYITQVNKNNIKINPSLSKVGELFYLYIKRDSYYKKFSNKSFRLFLNLICLYIRTYGLSRFIKVAMKKLFRKFK